MGLAVTMGGLGARIPQRILCVRTCFRLSACILSRAPISQMGILRHRGGGVIPRDTHLESGRTGNCVQGIGLRHRRIWRQASLSRAGERNPMVKAEEAGFQTGHLLLTSEVFCVQSKAFPLHLENVPKMG